jgi:hypothetical protein
MRSADSHDQPPRLSAETFGRVGFSFQLTVSPDNMVQWETERIRVFFDAIATAIRAAKGFPLPGQPPPESPSEDS